MATVGEGGDDQAAAFAAHRSLLFTVAYELLGSAVDAEDVVQEAWLRWADIPLAEVRDPRAYLVRITTRLGLNRLRTLARRKESYVGPWLPEPLLTAPDVADDVVLADSVSTAMLLVLESLGPVERAVFVLREVFDLPYEEIAAAVDKSGAAVRQIAGTGDLQSLMDALAPDAVLISDGGGVRQAALRPIAGSDKIARFLLGTSAKPGESGQSRTVDILAVNGTLAVRILDGETVDSIATVSVANGLVSAIYIVRNPAKLGFAAQPTARLAR